MLLPLAFFCIVPAWSVEDARFVFYLFQFEFEQASYYEHKSGQLFVVVEILGLVTSLTSCLILSLVIRHVFKLSKKVKHGSNAVMEKSRVNTFVTCSHIGVTIAFTISQSVLIFYKNFTQDARMYTAFYFFGGLSDIFLSLMLWFILDSDKPTTFYLDGDRVYSVRDVINTNHSIVSEDCNEEEEDEISRAD